MTSPRHETRAQAMDRGDTTPPQDSPILCIVAPCYNEEDSLPAFYEALQQALAALEELEIRILFIDDGSTDATLDMLNELSERDARVRVASLSRNFGHQIALSAGFALAEGDAVVIMDSDLQHPPLLLPEMVKLWRQGYDIVSAIRRSTVGESRFKTLTSRLFYRLINYLSDTPIVPGVADFCLLSRTAHAALAGMTEQHPFLRGMVSWIGFRRTFVYYDAPPRVAGDSKYNLKKMLRLARDALLSFSVTPIRFMGLLGLVISAFGFLYLIYILLQNMFFGELVPGWSSVISTVLILGGLQLVFTGVIGTYIANILEEVRQRPRFLLKQDITAWPRAPMAPSSGRDRGE